jgi:hypothetical protein
MIFEAPKKTRNVAGKKSGRFRKRLDFPGLLRYLFACLAARRFAFEWRARGPVCEAHFSRPANRSRFDD